MSRHRVGVDLGGTKIEAIVLAPDGKVVERERIATPASEGYAAVVESIGALVERLERPYGRLSVGIGTPGSIARDSGAIKNSNSVVLNGQPLRDDLQRRLERPIRLANDANCLTLSEASDGAGAGAAVVFGVILGTGVGGGLCVHGRVIEGMQGIAGEWGHNPLEPEQGPECYCGRRGCVETLLSGTGFARDYRLAGGEQLDGAAIMERARAGESLANDIFERYVARLGRALACVINILDPNVIVLGGGMSKVAELYASLPGALPPYVFNDEVLTLIRPAHHGDSSGVRGAAWLWGL